MRLDTGLPAGTGPRSSSALDGRRRVEDDVAVQRPASVVRPVLADGLTGTRAVASPLLALVVGGGQLELGAFVLSLSWILDALDGAAARAASGPTRLGRWDLVVDSLVGAGLLLGLAASAHVSWVLAAAVLVVLGGGSVALGNPALAMAMQAVPYGTFMWLLFHQNTAWWWLPPATVIAIGIACARRFTQVVLPEFFSGIGSLFPRRAPRE